MSEAEELHLFALKLATNSFGECNVQTAKHYGNLGRLYQVREWGRRENKDKQKSKMT